MKIKMYRGTNLPFQCMLVATCHSNKWLYLDLFERCIALLAVFQIGVL
jgi:hypothetical protein